MFFGCFLLWKFGYQNEQTKEVENIPNAAGNSSKDTFAEDAPPQPKPAGRELLPRGEKVFLSRNELSYYFQDNSLTEERMKEIKEDVENAHKHLSKQITDGWLSYEGKGRRRPPALKSLGRIVEIDGVNSLEIPTTVSDEYRKTFDFLEEKNISLEEAKEIGNLLEKKSRIRQERGRIVS